jgi:hypothetical protein
MSEGNPVKVILIDPLSILYEFVEQGLRTWFHIVIENFHRERKVLMTIDQYRLPIDTIFY